MYTFGFIGTGNMGGALAKAASKSTKNILPADHFAEKAEALANTLGVDCGDNIAVVKNCEYVFLGVKPQMMGDMLALIAGKVYSCRIIKYRFSLLLNVIQGDCNFPTSPIPHPDREAIFIPFATANTKKLRYLMIAELS